jgi:hypothetical protein
MYRSGPTFVGMKVIQAGTVDDMDILNDLHLDVELFAPNRLGWVPKLQGVEDKHDMN